MVTYLITEQIKQYNTGIFKFIFKIRTISRKTHRNGLWVNMFLGSMRYVHQHCMHGNKQERDSKKKRETGREV